MPSSKRGGGGFLKDGYVEGEENSSRMSSLIKVSSVTAYGVATGLLPGAKSDDAVAVEG